MTIMRAVIVRLTEEELAHRRSMGLDRWDEMWEGVPHFTPAPTVEHQRILDELIMFLGRHLSATGRGTLRSGIHVFRGSDRSDYRIPDLTFISIGREHILHEEGVRVGGPDAVIEIRWPEDETYEKLPFYAALRVREVVIVDRDTKRPELYRLAGSQYVALQHDARGSLRSEAMLVSFKAIVGPPARLRVEDASDSSAHVEI